MPGRAKLLRQNLLNKMKLKQNSCSRPKTALLLNEPSRGKDMVTNATQRPTAIAEEQETHALLTLIQKRHSTRGPFNPDRVVTTKQVKLILEAARWAPTPDNMQNFSVVVVDDKERLEAIAKIPAEMSETYLRETYEHVSFSEAELTHKKKGTLANIYPRAWTDPEAWNPESDARSQLTVLGGAVLEPQVLLIVLYDASVHSPDSKGDAIGLMGLGCVMENMWLMSESEGLGMHVLTVFRNGAVERQVQHALQIPPPMKIAFACSLGYPASPAEPYLRVRRDLEDFVHHNQFGQKDVLWSAMHPASFPDQTS
jgi:nitroreductase